MDNLKIKYFSLFTLLLILSLVLVACSQPLGDDTGGLYDRNRLTTQTRIGDRDNNFDDGLGSQNGLFGNDTNDNLNQGMTRSNQTNNFGNMGTQANEIANKIADLPEVSNASVVISDDTALVGLTLRGNTQGTMTNALRQKIRGIVQDSTDIDNVSITTDAGMTRRIKNMSTSILQGNPIENFADEVRKLIDDITPNTNNSIMR